LRVSQLCRLPAAPAHRWHARSQASVASRASTSASAKELHFEFKLPEERSAIGRVKKLLEM
jgi:hypothetical protein